jgi:hypothetical protein
MSSTINLRQESTPKKPNNVTQENQSSSKLQSEKAQNPSILNKPDNSSNQDNANLNVSSKTNNTSGTPPQFATNKIDTQATSKGIYSPAEYAQEKMWDNEHYRNSYNASPHVQGVLAALENAQNNPVLNNPALRNTDEYRQAHASLLHEQNQLAQVNNDFASAYLLGNVG